MAVLEKRLELTVLDDSGTPVGGGSDLVTALCQDPKVLPPRFLYDARGRELYARLARLPEYYMPRTAKAVLKRYASTLPKHTGSADLIELGASDMATTRELLDAYRKPGRPQLYVPVAADAAMIQESAPGLLRQYPDLTVHGLSGDGGSAVGALPPRRADSRLVLCLDNALGMLDAAASRVFLRSVRGTLQDGDWVLAGLDLEAEIEVLEAAYNDSEGLNAALCFNALHQINRYYGGNADTGKYLHSATYNEAEHRIEMRLTARERQVISMPVLGFQFELLAGGHIITEFSRKFTMSRIRDEFADADFAFVEAWADAKELYALFLFRAE